jgi:plastocyanin
MRPGLLTVLLATLCTAALATEPRVIVVTLNNYTIKPDTLILKAGEPVILKVKNEATFIPHNLVIKAAQAGIELKVVVGAGKTSEVRFTPTQPGNYELLCDTQPPIGKSHQEKGMHGMMVVE